MGFFEDHLASIGRGLDASVEWCGDRWRAVSDRGRHARSFEAVRDRMERAAGAAKSGAGRAAEEARDRWRRRDPVDRDSARRVLLWAGVLAALMGVGLGLRVLTREKTNPLTAQELELMRRVRDVQTTDGSGPAQGLRGWTSSGP